MELPEFRVVSPMVGLTSQADVFEYITAVSELCQQAYGVRPEMIAVSKDTYRLLRAKAASWGIPTSSREKGFTVMGMHVIEVPWLYGLVALPLPCSKALESERRELRKLHSVVSEVMEKLDGLV